ncbi:hypothetical protein [Rhodospirillaceae bacterium SYSU D60014]|uniref:hypothetical protein n=1 Tax=Virgifigura deserti TaxID=2268457 RepID=UPI000E675A52
MRRLALLIVLLALPASAVAEPTACSKRTEVVAHLAKKFKEAPAALGLASNGGLLEVLTNGNGSTWTIIVTMPNGISCLVAAGEDWQNLAKLAIDEPAI